MSISGKTMLSHIASSLPYVFYLDTRVCRPLNPALRKCYDTNNILGFIHIYRQACDENILIAWDRYIHFLSQAISLYPPSEDMANYIILVITFPWSPRKEEVIKLLLHNANDYNKSRLVDWGYYHLVPHYRQPDDLLHILSKALEVNNIKEVRHILTLTNDLKELSLYDVIANLAPIKAIIAHFNYTVLDDITVDKDIFALAEKFKFDLPLLLRCVKLGGLGLITQYQLHIRSKLPIITYILSNT